MVQIICPSCGYGRTWKLRRNKRKCKKCRGEFSEQIYPIKHFRISEETWLRAIRIFLRERTIIRMSEELEISQKSAQKISNHIRTCMKNISLPMFFGPVEMDETYIGGQRKNKKLHIRRIQGKRGHGTDKLPIVGVFDRCSGQIIVEVEPRKLDIQFILKLIKHQVMPGSKIYTDGYKMYRSLPKHGFVHEYVDHAGGELVRGEIHTNNIEGFWGILKRKLGCIGGIRRNKLPLFVAEIVWKYNHRKLTLKDREKALFELIIRR